MAQVLTNNTGLQFARESSLGVLPGSPDWKTLEPNTQDEFGATITTVPREPISKLRQDRKGTTTDLDAANKFGADLTFDSLLDFSEAFCWANAVNNDLTFRAAPAIATPGFTIPSATASQAARLQWTAGGPISLMHAAGYVDAANNSVGTVFEIAADVGVSDVVIEIAGLAVETPPTNAELSLAGIRAEAGDLDVAVASNIATITSGNNAASVNIDFTTLGLTLGQTIHVGGLTATNRFGSTAGGSNDSYGYCRVRTIAAGTLTCDKIPTTLTASDGTDTGSGGSLVATDLLFGRFVRNVQSDHADYNRISHTFEQETPALFDTDPPSVSFPDGFEYVRGAVPNVWEWTLAVSNKATCTMDFVGTTADPPVDNDNRETDAETPRAPLFTEALNTSNDFVRLGVFDVDDTGLTTDFKDLTVTINNNVEGEKVLAFEGSKYINNGNFQFQVAGDALFTNPLVATRIRQNTTITMNWIVRNSEGVCAVDIPSAVIQSDGKAFPVNKTVTINITVKAFVDPLFDTSIGMSFFPVAPAA